MTDEELNTRLYEKMFAEQEAYKKTVLAMNPKEVLEHAYEYLAREDILLNQECNDLSATQCKALLKLKNTMNSLYERWLKTEDSRMEDIRFMVEGFADRLIREAREREDSAR